MKRWHLTIALAALAAGGAWLSHRVRVESPVLIGFVPTANDVRRAASNTKIGTASIDFFLRTDPRIAACFADARAHMGTLPDVVVRVHLLSNGRPDSVVVSDPATLTGTGLAMCLTTTIETMGFYVPDDATPTWVSYHFEADSPSPSGRFATTSPAKAGEEERLRRFRTGTVAPARRKP